MFGKISSRRAAYIAHIHSSNVHERIRFEGLILSKEYAEVGRIELSTEKTQDRLTRVSICQSQRGCVVDWKRPVTTESFRATKRIKQLNASIDSFAERRVNRTRTTPDDKSERGEKRTCRSESNVAHIILSLWSVYSFARSKTIN